MATQPRREITLGGPLYVEPGPERLDPEALFGRRAPLLIDIGAARARYFLNVAPALPGVNLLGIEVKKIRVEAALERLHKHAISNCRMLCGNALRVIAERLDEGAVAAFTVLFPDPWPKKRHEKRRIFQQPETARLFARHLAPGGVVLFKTDAPEYFGPVREALCADPDLEETLDPVVAVPGHPVFSLDVPQETYYEQKWRAEGRSFRQVLVRRRG